VFACRPTPLTFTQRGEDVSPWLCRFSRSPTRTTCCPARWPESTRPEQDAQKPRPLHENGTMRSRPHESQWTRMKPCEGIPQSRNVSFAFICTINPWMPWKQRIWLFLLRVYSTKLYYKPDAWNHCKYWANRVLVQNAAKLTQEKRAFRALRRTEPGDRVAADLPERY